MPVGLTCPRVLAGIKKAKKLLPSLAVAFQTSISSFNIIFFKDICLFLECLRGKDEVIGGYRELVEDEKVSRQPENEQSRGRVSKWVKRLLVWVSRLVGLGFVCQGRGIPDLELRDISASTRSD